MTRALLVLVLLAGSAVAGPLVEPGERLPRVFVPSGYRLRLAVEDKLVGSVEIAGVLASATVVVWLDFTGTVTQAAARRDTDVVPLRVEVHGARIALVAAAPLAAGAWAITVEFTSKIDDQGVVDLPRDGDKRDAIREEMAAARTTATGAFRQTVDGAAYTFTQSEPMDARTIFPCIDEPDRKVPWQLALDIDDKLLAASNAPIANETSLGQGKKRVEFAPTRPLPATSSRSRWARSTRSMPARPRMACRSASSRPVATPHRGPPRPR